MQQHGSKYFARRSPTPDPGGWVKRIWSFSISNRNRRECRMQQHGNKYYALRTTTPPHADPPFYTGVWSKGQNSTFSIFCLPANLGADVKRSKFNFFFRKMVMLHIKLKGMVYAAKMVANILHADCPVPRV